jgi:hypothetical protein
MNLFVQASAESQRGDLVVAGLAACSLKYSGVDHALLASSGLLDAVSAILTASHVIRQLEVCVQRLQSTCRVFLSV